jgi:hypothetical protein
MTAEPTVYFNTYNYLFYWEADGRLHYGAELDDNALTSQFYPDDLISKSDPNNPDSFFFPITNLE